MTLYVAETDARVVPTRSMLHAVFVGVVVCAVIVLGVSLVGKLVDATRLSHTDVGVAAVRSGRGAGTLGHALRIAGAGSALSGERSRGRGLGALPFAARVWCRWRLSG